MSIFKLRNLFGLLILLDLVLAVTFVSIAEVLQPSIESLNKADAAVVFFDDFGGSSGLSQESMKRATDAASLYKAGKVSYVFCVGGYRENKFATGSMYLATYLESLKVPLEIVSIDRKSFSTQGNLEAVSSMLKDLKLNSLIYVSSPVHLIRIKALSAIDAQSYSSGRLRNSNLTQVIEDAHYELGAWIVNFVLPEELADKVTIWFRNV
ncbi:MAG: YdcF family protein [Bdellovibrionota bacterium]